jgi:hypothetical protein
MKLDKKAFGLTAGILWGAAIFLATNILILKGGVGTTIISLNHYYIGYSFSFIGSLIGMVWGFVNGFIAGWLFAFFHNLFVKTS